MVWVTLIITIKVSSNHLDNIKSSSSSDIVIVVQVFQSMVIHILPFDLPGAPSEIFTNPVDWLVIIYDPYTLLTWDISPKTLMTEVILFLYWQCGLKSRCFWDDCVSRKLLTKVLTRACIISSFVMTILTKLLTKVLTRICIMSFFLLTVLTNFTDCSPVFGSCICLCWLCKSSCWPKCWLEFGSCISLTMLTKLLPKCWPKFGSYLPLCWPYWPSCWPNCWPASTWLAASPCSARRGGLAD